MATQSQITYLKGKLAIATQFAHELSTLTGAAVRGYGGRRRLDIDINSWQGQRAAYQLLLRLAAKKKFFSQPRPARRFDSCTPAHLRLSAKAVHDIRPIDVAVPGWMEGERVKWLCMALKMTWEFIASTARYIRAS